MAKVELQLFVSYENVIIHELFQDYERTLSELPNLFDNYTIPYERWNHVDFLWAKNIDTQLHPRVLQNLAAGEQQFS